jgi:hypothetical protein
MVRRSYGKEFIITRVPLAPDAEGRVLALHFKPRAVLSGDTRTHFIIVNVYFSSGKRDMFQKGKHIVPGCPSIGTPGIAHASRSAGPPPSRPRLPTGRRPRPPRLVSFGTPPVLPALRRLSSSPRVVWFARESLSACFCLVVRGLLHDRRVSWCLGGRTRLGNPPWATPPGQPPWATPLSPPGLESPDRTGHWASPAPAALLVLHFLGPAFPSESERGHLVWCPWGTSGPAGSPPA